MYFVQYNFLNKMPNRLKEEPLFVSTKRKLQKLRSCDKNNFPKTRLFNFVAKDVKPSILQNIDSIK